MQLGQIMIDKKWISKEQLVYAVYLSSSSNIKLEELMIKFGWIVNEQLEQALKELYWRNQGYWVID